MHRLLIAYESTAIIVFSLNKNRQIQTINLNKQNSERGKALAVEWIGPDCD